MGIRVATCCLSILLVSGCIARGPMPDPSSSAQREDIAEFRGRFFAMELCRIAALADNAHTQCLPQDLGQEICAGLASLGLDDPRWCQPAAGHVAADPADAPIALFPFGEDMHVIGVGASMGELLGARLISVDGREIDAIRAVLHEYAGGTRAHRDEVAARILANPARLHAIGLAADPGAARYRFARRDGGQVERVLASRKPTDEQDAWLSAPAASNAAWAFRDPHDPFRYVDAPEIDSMVVQLRKTFDHPGRPVAEFLDAVERERAALGRRNIVLDMRFNGGGNFLLVRDFMLRWPGRVPGRFYVLTSRRTFSAAITSIAYLEQQAPDRVIIVGEPIGDRLEFFSDGLPVRLPRSGLYFQPAVVRMDYRDGCRRHDDCAAPIAQPGRAVATAALPFLTEPERIPITIASLQPDISASWTIDDWLAGRDPMLDAVRLAIGHPVH